MIFDKLYIKGAVFSIFGQLGPEAIFSYPIPEDSSVELEDRTHYTSKYSQSNYMQVAVKSISLLLSDYSFDNPDGVELDKVQIFGVLPYPDIKTIGFTYFTYYFSTKCQQYVPATLTLFVPENHRSYIYDALSRLKEPIQDFTREMIAIINQNKISSELEGMDYFQDNISLFLHFFSKLQNIQAKPISPITKHRRIKILFTGLENTGKTSFLLTIKRNFSELPSLLPTTEPTKDTLNFLGTTILKWDIPGNKELRNVILTKSETFIFDTDVLYYFIDIQNPRIAESVEFLKNIVQVLGEHEQKIPFIFIITKFDEDITQREQIQHNLAIIKVNIIPIVQDHPYKFFHTSIFSIYSVLNAFSYGLRQLSPNRELLEHLLKDFITKNKILTGLLMNENGLVIASVQRPLMTKTNILPINQVFEIAAPQFTTIAHQFSQLSPKAERNSVKYQFSDEDFVYLRKFTVHEFTFFGLFYSKSSKTDKILVEKFEKFKNRIENLLILYIA
ncbi:MAG: ADP-ribosylation factor-like protein [Promethearchaeota archaeon]